MFLFNNSSVIKVTLPKSVKTIEAYAFGNCSSLKEINLPEGLKTIGDSSFSECSSLESVSIPASVESVGYNAFSHCTSMTSLNISSAATELMGNAFGTCSALTEVELPNGTTAVPEYLFPYCENLKKVTLPQTVTSIGSEAFLNCKSLEDIDNPASVISIGSSAFSGCRALSELTLPEGVKTVEDSTFLNCVMLKDLTVNGELTSIGKSAFKNCRLLTEFTVPATVTSIGESAFEGCSSISDFTFPKTFGALGKAVLKGCSSLARVTLSDNLYTIGDNAFDGCSALESIDLPETLRSIGNRAFAESGLKSLTVPDAFYSLGEAAFSECSELSEINIPSAVQTLPRFFLQGSGITKIDIPNSVTTIEISSFYNCDKLERVDIPESVTTIYASAFSDCAELSYVFIPDSVTNIFSYAFDGCEKLVIVCNPDSYAESYAVQNNIAFKYINYSGKLVVNTGDKFNGFVLKASDSQGNSVSRVIKGGKGVFSGCDKRLEYKVELINRFGRTIAEENKIKLTDDITTLSFEELDLPEYSVKVFGDNGDEVGGYTVSWAVLNPLYVESDNEILAGLNIGDSISCSVKLGDELKKTYEEPAAVITTVTEKRGVVEIHLKKAETKIVTIKAVDSDNKPLSGADIDIVQKISAKTNTAANYTTDENGEVSVTLRTIETTVKASRLSHFSASWSGVVDGSEIVVVLRTISGMKFTPNIPVSCIENTVGFSAATEPVADSLTFAVRNKTTGTAVESFSYLNGCITIPEDKITSGDILEFTAVDNNGVYADAAAEVEYKGSDLSFDMELAEKGRINVSYSSNNDRNLAIIFNSDGSYAQTLDLEKNALSDNLDSGDYKVVLIGYSSMLYKVRSVYDVGSCGLEENTHYITRDVTVKNGELTSVDDAAIPEFNDETILFVDKSKTSLSVNPTSIVVGKRSTLTINYSLLGKYADSCSVSAVEVYLPDGLKPYENIVVNKFHTSDFELDGSKMIIPVTEKCGKLVISLFGEAYVEDESVFAKLRIEKNGSELTQPIGSANITMKESFSVPAKTSLAEFNVSGSVGARAAVDIYVDGKLQKTVTASQMGSFKTSVKLSDTFSHTYHEIRFETENAMGETYRSKTYDVEFEKNYTYVDSISMSPNGMYGGSVKLYSADGNYSGSYYYWPGKYDTLTYTVEFVGTVSNLAT